MRGLRKSVTGRNDDQCAQERVTHYQNHDFSRRDWELAAIGRPLCDEALLLWLPSEPEAGRDGKFRFLPSGACLISPPHLIWTVQGGMDSRESGNDGVGMRRANSSFRRKAECRRWETRMPQLCETGSLSLISREQLYYPRRQDRKNPCTGLFDRRSSSNKAARGYNTDGLLRPIGS